MKRSDFYIRLTTGVLFLAVACYLGFYLYTAFANTYETTVAISYSVEETLATQGYIVRTETVLDDFGVNILPIIIEGSKVAAGQVIAVEYYDNEALEIASEIRTLSMRIHQLESPQGSSVDSNLETIRDLSVAIHLGNLRRLDEIVLNIEAGIFEAETDIQVLKSRLEALEARHIGARMITANMSGTFSHVVDGFEHISPDVIRGLSPSDLIAHFRTPFGQQGAGKLVTEFKWYYAAFMRGEDAAMLSVGQTKSVQFFGTYQAEMSMLVEEISRREDDICVVLFSSDRSIHEIAPLRAINADIVFDVITGIRIPKEALRLDDNGEHVFLQTSGYAERVAVERIKDIEIGDNYLVRDGIETGTPLRAGSIIIVRANNLYHGKVVG